jgi:signal transduction histidine kinase/ligand-binding sensor domain-containing protein/AraC-like DNA-binding protein
MKKNFFLSGNIKILLLCTLLSTPLSAQFVEPKFENITVQDGLPENNVWCILQDHLGFLWFGTSNGLVKYDGYEMNVYEHIIDNPESMTYSSVYRIFEDRTGILWVGTGSTYGGVLNRFDRSTETFKHYLHNSKDSISISSSHVLSFCEDSKGRLWFGTSNGLNLWDQETDGFESFFIPDTIKNNSDKQIISAIIEEPSTHNLIIGSAFGGLWNYDPSNKKFIKLQLFFNKENKIEINEINSLYRSNDGIVWVASKFGFIKYDSKSDDAKLFQPQPTLGYNTKNDFHTAIEEIDGLLWVGTAAGNLACFDPEKEIFKLFKNDPNDVSSISPSSPWGILSIYKDRSGILWVGSADFGLNKWDKYKIKFNSYKFNLDEKKSIGNSLVTSMCEDRTGNIWVGTYGGGLSKFDREKKLFVNFKREFDRKNSLNNNEIMSIYEDPYDSGILWIGTNGSGLYKYESKNNQFKLFRHNENNEYSLSNDSIYFTLADGKDIIWVCTWRGGINKFNRKTEQCTHYYNNPNDSTSISSNDAWYCFKDKLGVLWFGTANGNEGLSRYDYNKDNFHSYGNEHEYMQFNMISTICEDHKGNFWLGEYATGLYLFDRTKGIPLNHYTERNGLAHNQVMSILEDVSGNLWIGTYNGLSRFNPVSKRFRNFYEEDGLSSNRLFFRSAFLSKSGDMFFGGENGFTWFNSENIKDDPTPPMVVITNLSLFNRPKEKLKIDGFISEMKEVRLPHNYNDLHFNYVGLHFSDPVKNKYKYMLENFDEDWVEAGTQRNAVYTNLDPGEYIFRVEAANRDGIWSKKDASIRIVILPPWWATTWAYALYTLIISSIVYFMWKLQLKRIRIKHDYEMSKFEAEKLQEVDELKSRFFANISHEFRTPLMLILGLSKKILDKAKDQVFKDDINVIKRNANRLHGLVNQLLDLSKLESGNMTLRTSPQNIIPLLKGLVLSFASFAERKRIKLKFNSKEEEIVAYIDKDKIEKIVTNLLSNAFKFTPEGGRVEVVINCQAELVSASSVNHKIPKQVRNDKNGFVEISISDTGIGISPDRIDKIFDRFYQVDSSHTREQEGTGLGLALTKELVELHKGQIEVESSEGKGSTFIVTLPLGKVHLKPEEIIEGKLEGEDAIPEELELSTEYDEQKVRSYIELVTETEKLLLLIVEDNSDVRNYIKGNLEDDYRILEAVDGANGLEQALNQIPDLIISDVMMPKMDGFELCEKLKTDERTSHIPVILLTAKATDKDKVAGYETGADDYIMKPFDNFVLKTRIKNLILQRERLSEHFINEGIFQINDTNATSIDKMFLKKVLDIINEHMSDETFGVDSFAEEIAMSRSQLRRKLIALSGKAPGDLIRTVRLTKAAKLIEQHFGNISEIAAEVGFNNPANFARIFKSHFGVSPTEYLNSKKS